jgi:TonB family protein
MTARLLHREGRAQVRFDYTNGAAADVAIAASSQSAELDEAAISAVRHAALPRAPATIGNRTLALLVWVHFGLASED